MKKDNNRVIGVEGKSSNFWAVAGLLAILLASTMARDINRPFYGLHSWGEAAMAWRARCYLKYNLSYTKGLAVWAVGDPPSENPNRSLDHPQLGLFLPALDMAIFGMNERGIRIGGIIRAVISLLLFLKILRGLLDDKTALLAGLLFVIFPITGYFGAQAWLTPLSLVSLLAIWCYLVVIGSIKNGPEPKAYHKWVLAVSLFLMLQLRWEGFFYALAIGVHYVFRCIHRRQFPEKVLLAILIIAPLTGLIIDFAVMAAGHGWDWQKIWTLFKWRAAKGEMASVMPRFDWGMWFARFWNYAKLNFTLPVLIITLAYLTLGQLSVFTWPASGKKNAEIARRFPQFWLFLMPAVFQLFILRGALWQHQYWESPLVPFIAIATALAIMLLKDLLARVSRLTANVAVVSLVGIIFISCTMGLNYYYNIRWRSPTEIEMFKGLNKRIPPDKALLSFDDFIVNQNSAKGPHYRPEVAWYLDREITSARVVENGQINALKTIKVIEQKAGTGKYPYYLIPRAGQTMPLINRLSQRYKYEYIPGHQGERTKDGKFLRVGMLSYMIFDLNSTNTGG